MFLGKKLKLTLFFQKLKNYSDFFHTVIHLGFSLMR